MVLGGCIEAPAFLVVFATMHGWGKDDIMPGFCMKPQQSRRSVHYSASMVMASSYPLLRP